LSPQAYVLILGEHHFQREERRGEELDAVDIFKATHHSKKDGFSEEALAAIVSDLFISLL
jgi:hypothetical protein